MQKYLACSVVAICGVLMIGMCYAAEEHNMQALDEEYARKQELVAYVGCVVGKLCDFK